MSAVEKYAHLFSQNDLSPDLSKHSVRGAGYTVTAEAVDFVLRLVSVGVLARLLVPEDFGLLAMVTAITLVAERFKDLGLGVPTVQAKQLTHHQTSNLFWLNAGFGFLLFALIISVGPLIARFYNDDRLTYIAWALSTSLLIGSLSVQHHALLRRQMRFGRMASIQIGASVSSLVLAVWMAVAGYGYWALVAREVSRAVIGTIAGWLLCRWVPGLPNRGGHIRAMVSMGGDLTASNVLLFLTSSVDQVLVGKLFGPARLGFYRQGYSLGVATVGQLFNPIVSVAEPALCSLQNDPSRFRRYYLRLVEGMSLVSMPISMLLVLFGHEIILVVLGNNWLDAVPVFVVCALTIYVRPSLATASAAMISMGRSRAVLVLTLVHCCVLLALYVVGSQWGTIGVAFAHVITSCLLIAPTFKYGLAHSPISFGDFLGATARPAFASIVMAVALWLIRAWLIRFHPVVTLLLGISVGMALYLGVWVLLPDGRAKLIQLATAVLRPLLPSRLRLLWTETEPVFVER